MTPNEFYTWLTGFLDAVGEDLTNDQLRIIREKLKSVVSYSLAKGSIPPTQTPPFIPQSPTAWPQLPKQYFGAMDVGSTTASDLSREYQNVNSPESYWNSPTFERLTEDFYDDSIDFKVEDVFGDHDTRGAKRGRFFD